jgi:hypothetical protein
MAANDGMQGATEVRVHGVSGTPPDNILQMPPVWTRLVHGTSASGFYRRWAPGTELPPTEEGVDRVEAYSWGGLTSGSASRSLWLLVLPFTLVDVAHWMMPILPADASGRRRATAAVSVALLRVLSISITLTGVAAFSLITLDLTGWQCAGVPRCAQSHAYVDWLTHFGRPEQRVAAMAVIPSLILALVWYIGRSRITSHSAPDPVVVAGDLPLAKPTFFDPDPGVVRLRRFHVIAAACMISALVLVPLVRYADNAGWPRTLLIFNLVLGGLAVLATCSQSLAGRGGSSAEWANWPTKIGQLLSVFALVVTLGSAFLVHTSGHPAVSHLPGLRGVVIGLFGVQLALVPLLLGTVAIQHRDAGVRAGAVSLLAFTGFSAVVMLWWAFHQIGHDQADTKLHVPHGVYTALVLVGLSFAWVITRAWRHSPAPVTFVTPTESAGPVGLPPVAAGGLGAPLVATLAWLYSLALGAGVGLQVAQLLGHPVLSTAVATTAGQTYDKALAAGDVAKLQTLGDTPLIVPPGFIWAAVGAVFVGLIAVALGAYTFLHTLPHRRRIALIEASVDYPDPQVAKQAAAARALASLTDDAGVLAGTFVSATLVAGFVLLVAYLHYGQKLSYGLGLLAGVGSWVVVAFVGGLLSLGYASLRNRSLRRTVGILWDVCTFWPRANHPFTPPPYTECAVPDLLARIRSLSQDESDRVVLSAHSQGSVIAVPVALRLDAEHLDRVRLLLHGCPVARLYARWFPAYFSVEVFDALGERFPGRWRTLYRRTDYIGGWAITRDTDRAASYVPGNLRVAPDDQVDQEVPDPPLAGGPPKRHSDYWLEPVYTATVAHLMAPEPSGAQHMGVRQRTETDHSPANVGAVQE